MFNDEQWLLVSIILLLALVTVVLGMWLQLALLRTRMSSRLTHIEEKLIENSELHDIQIKVGRELQEIVSRLADESREIHTAFEALKLDVTRLSDDVRGEVGVSRAIDLARSGATVEAVADETNLSLEEAEAIVTFHGRPKS